MAYAVTHFFAGGTKAQYDAALKTVHPGGKLPAGQIFHAAGTTPGGFLVFAMHDSKESWEKFRDTVLMPAFKKGIKGGFEKPPEERQIDICTIEQALPAHV
jgi:hypothetical protein